ncbi:AAA family ATPase [Pontibacter sp. G13]|uniref:ATP-binding protein n=1 Tax=Pontibacter sp. G13 TaxID=3074898 RepID=UPI00288B6208|nr:AAA family ATPase [Pontibacter sp. G13]WNJ16092.1 AAA family ATPase [Pontibacter sp. G13]
MSSNQVPQDTPGTEVPVEVTPSETPTPVAETPAKPKVEVPEWAHEIKRKYLSQNVSQFIVHGNINDYVPVKRDDTMTYYRLRDFLNQEMFKYKDTVIYYDRAAGIKFIDDTIFGGDGSMRKDFLSTMKLFDELTDNNFSELTRNPARSFFTLDTYFNLLVNQEFLDSWVKQVEQALVNEEKPAPEQPKNDDDDIIDRFMRMTLPDFTENKKENKGVTSMKQLKERLASFKKRLSKPRSVAFVIDYAETLIPMTDQSSYRPDEHMLLVFLQKWAREPKFLEADFTIVTLTESLNSLNAQYIRNPYTYDVSISYPDDDSRLAFIEDYFKRNPDDLQYFEMPKNVLAKNTAGLGLVHLDTIISEAVRNKLLYSNDDLTKQKKEMIEAEAGGLLEFIQTKYNLKDVAGHAQAKKHLTDASRALKNGRPDVMPMGYLVSGPVGTGKTYMIRCFANDIGVPMVLLKNFRGMYVGQSEGNLQKVLKILKAMAPVAVMIDEADAYLGSRSDGGGSGVNTRIFSMLASFMSDTDNRGRIIWFLVTARPDLMPVDFKRQGRAEEHIALFYPETLEEKRELLEVMLKKTGIDYLDMEDFDEEFFEDITVKSGADMEAALTRAKFKAATLGLDQVNVDILVQVFNDFLPPTYPEEIELMEYSAVLECTSKELLPKRFRKLSRQEVLETVQDLKMRIR